MRLLQQVAVVLVGTAAGERQQPVADRARPTRDLRLGREIVDAVTLGVQLRLTRSPQVGTEPDVDPVLLDQESLAVDAVDRHQAARQAVEARLEPVAVGVEVGVAARGYLQVAVGGDRGAADRHLVERIDVDAGLADDERAQAEHVYADLLHHVARAARRELERALADQCYAIADRDARDVGERADLRVGAGARERAAGYERHVVLREDVVVCAHPDQGRVGDHPDRLHVGRCADGDVGIEGDAEVTRDARSAREAPGRALHVGRRDGWDQNPQNWIRVLDIREGRFVDVVRRGEADFAREDRGGRPDGGVHGRDHLVVHGHAGACDHAARVGDFPCVEGRRVLGRQAQLTRAAQGKVDVAAGADRGKRVARARGGGFGRGTRGDAAAAGGGGRIVGIAPGGADAQVARGQRHVGAQGGAVRRVRRGPRVGDTGGEDAACGSGRLGVLPRVVAGCHADVARDVQVRTVGDRRRHLGAVGRSCDRGGNTDQQAAGAGPGICIRGLAARGQQMAGRDAQAVRGHRAADGGGHNRGQRDVRPGNAHRDPCADGQASGRDIRLRLCARADGHVARGNGRTRDMGVHRRVDGGAYHRPRGGRRDQSDTRGRSANQGGGCGHISRVDHEIGVERQGARLHECLGGRQHGCIGGRAAARKRDAKTHAGGNGGRLRGGRYRRGLQRLDVYPARAGRNRRRTDEGFDIICNEVARQAHPDGDRSGDQAGRTGHRCGGGTRRNRRCIGCAKGYPARGSDAAATRAVAIDVRIHLGANLVPHVRTGAGAGSRNRATGDRHGARGNIRRHGRVRGRGLGQRTAGDDARIDHIGLHLGRRLNPRERVADQVVGRGRTDRNGPRDQATTEGHGKGQDLCRNGGGIRGQQDGVPSAGQIAAVHIRVGPGEDDVLRVRARPAEAQADDAATQRCTGGHRRSRHRGTFDGLDLDIATGTRGHAGIGCQAAAAVGVLDVRLDDVADFVVRQAKSDRYRDSHRTERSRHRRGSRRCRDGGSIVCREADVVGQYPGGAIAVDVGCDEGGYLVFGAGACAARGYADCSACGRDRPGQNRGGNGLAGCRGLRKVAARSNARAQHIRLHLRLLLGAVELPSNQVARARSAYGRADAGRAANRHRCRGGNHLRQNCRGVVRSESHVARRGDIARVDVRVDLREDDVGRLGACAADRNASHAAHGGPQRRRGSGRGNGRRFVRVQDHRARGRRHAIVGVLDRRLDLVGDAVPRQAYPDRGGDSRDAANRSGDRGGADGGIDRGAVMRSQGDAGRGDPGSIAIDVGPDLDRDIVGSAGTRTGERAAEGTAACQGNRSGQDIGVDGLVGGRGQREAAPGIDAGIRNIGLHFGGSAGAIQLHADQVARQCDSDGGADTRRAADSGRERCADDRGVDGRRIGGAKRDVAGAG